MAQVNQLTPYPLNDIGIAEWSRSLIDLISADDFDLEKIKFVIDAYKTCKLEYNREKGIQNIFLGLEAVEVTEAGFKIKPHRVW